MSKRFLGGKIAPTTTRNASPILKSEGITYPGESPLNNLSAALSNASEFVSHGRAGWTLAEIELKRLINDITDEMDPRVGLELANSWAASHNIPQEIDGKLLAAAREQLQRDLGERERASLREGGS